MRLEACADAGTEVVYTLLPQQDMQRFGNALYFHPFVDGVSAYSG